MAKNDSALQNIAASLPTSENKDIKGGTTTLLIKGLFEKDMAAKLGVAIKFTEEQKGSFARMARIDAELAPLNTKINEHSWIPEIVSRTRANIDGLGQFRSTAPLQAPLMNEFKPLQNDAAEREAQRQTIKENVRKIIIAEHRQFPQAIKALLEGKTFSEVKTLIDTIDQDKKNQELLLQRLEINEHSLLSKLTKLEDSTRNAVAVTGISPSQIRPER